VTPQPDTALTVRTYRCGEAVVVVAAGDLDMVTTPHFGDAVCAALDTPGRGPVVIDLIDVTFLDARGLSALVAASEDAAARHEPLRVVANHNRPVLHPLHLTGLDRELALYDTVADALHGGPRHQPITPD
jgi:anti-sigma B factor antagonist